jgi:5-methylthioadenosine/S-adenosylhomocysteine deaminase
MDATNPPLESQAPTCNIVANSVYAASGHEVRTVMVAGRVLVCDGVVLTVDEEAVRAEAQAEAEALARRVTADPVHKGMALLEAMEAGWL